MISGGLIFKKMTQPYPLMQCVKASGNDYTNLVLLISLERGGDLPPYSRLPKGYLTVMFAENGGITLGPKK